jgi:hypothetical protein
VPYRIEPHVAGELGEGTILDTSSHPPSVSAVEYVLDSPDADDLIESFPVVLVSERLAERLVADGLQGIAIADAEVVPSAEYRAMFGKAPHKAYRWLRVDPAGIDADAWLDDANILCVSDRMMATLHGHDLSRCTIVST